MEKPTKSDSSRSESAKPSDPIPKDINALLHNLSIAHKLAVREDSTEVGPKLEEITGEHLLKSTLHEAYWDLFKSEIFATPPKLDMAFELLDEIKKGLDVLMTPNITKLREQVSQILDRDVLKLEVEDGSIDVVYYAKYVIAVLAKICAPVRDNEIAKLFKENDVVNIFRGIMELISRMKQDLLTFSLSVITQDIVANQLSYERETFSEYVTAIGGKLPLTYDWLIRNKKENLTKEEVVHEAFIELLTWDVKKEFPETLFLEELRLRKLIVNYFQISISCTMILLSFSITPKTILNKEFKEYFKNFVSIVIAETSTENEIKKLTNNIAVELFSKIQSPEDNKSSEFTVENIQSSLDQALLPDNKIRELVSTRIKDYFKHSLKSCTVDEQFPASLNIFKEDINKLTKLFLSIFRHNEIVCMEHYRILLSDDYKPQEDPKSSK